MHFTSKYPSLNSPASIFYRKLSKKETEILKSGLTASSKLEDELYSKLFKVLHALGKKGIKADILHSQIPMRIGEDPIVILSSLGLLDNWLYGYSIYLETLWDEWLKVSKYENNNAIINTVYKQWKELNVYYKEVKDYHYGLLKDKAKEKGGSASGKKNYGDCKPGLIVNGKVLKKDGSVDNLGHYNEEDFFIFNEDVDPYEKELYTKFVFNNKQKMQFWATQYSELLNANKIERGVCPTNYKEFL